VVNGRFVGAAPKRLVCPQRRVAWLTNAELIQYVWHYKRDLVSQVFSNTDIFRSGKSKLAAAMESAAGPRSLKAISTSQPGLRYNVQPATPLEGDSPTEKSSLKSPRAGSTHDVHSDEESLESPKRRGVRRFLKEKFQKNKDLLESMPGQSTESVSPLTGPSPCADSR
jgi:hypothetical protein